MHGLINLQAMVKQIDPGKIKVDDNYLFIYLLFANINAGNISDNAIKCF